MTPTILNTFNPIIVPIQTRSSQVKVTSLAVFQSYHSTIQTDIIMPKLPRQLNSFNPIIVRFKLYEQDYQLPKY